MRHVHAPSLPKPKNLNKPVSVGEFKEFTAKHGINLRQWVFLTGTDWRNTNNVLYGKRDPRPVDERNMPGTHKQRMTMQLVEMYPEILDAWKFAFSRAHIEKNLRVKNIQDGI